MPKTMEAAAARTPAIHLMRKKRRLSLFKGGDARLLDGEFWGGCRGDAGSDGFSGSLVMAGEGLGWAGCAIFWIVLWTGVVIVVRD